MIQLEVLKPNQVLVTDEDISTLCAGERIILEVGHDGGFPHCYEADVLTFDGKHGYASLVRRKGRSNSHHDFEGRKVHFESHHICNIDR